MHVHKRTLFYLGDISIHTRDLERSFFVTEHILPGFQVVVTNFHVFDGTDGLELSPMHLVLLTKPSECFYELLTALKHEKESVVYLYCLHRNSLQSTADS